MTETREDIKTEMPQASSRLTEIVRHRARGADQTVAVVRKGGPAPGWFDPETQNITISLEQAGLDLTDDQLAAGAGSNVLDGLVLHEASHSVHSGWLFTDEARKVKPAVRHVLELIEEVRIEKRAIDQWRVRPALRHTVQALTLNGLDVSDINSMFALSHTWALTVGRMFATVVEADEVQAITDAAYTIIGDDVAYLEEILAEAVEVQTQTDAGMVSLHAVRQLIGLAEEWLAITGDPTEGEGGGTGEYVFVDEGDDSEGGAPAPGEPGDEDGDDDQDDGGGSNGDGEDDKDDSTSPGHGLSDEAKELLEKAFKKTTKEFKAQRQPTVTRANPSEMAKIFNENQTKRGGWTITQPTPSARRKAGQLARDLRAISYHAPDVTVVPAALPPGRLRTRAAVAASAQRARGQLVTVDPWTKKKRRHETNPPLTVGLATDTSGSMSWAQSMVAEAAFVVGHAVNSIGGRFAATTFGNKAEHVMKPGEVPTVIKTRMANGGQEAIDEALAALDAVLHLRNGTGARLLIIVSDNQLVIPGEHQRMELWYRELKKAGVAVVFADATTSHVIPNWVERVSLRTAGVEKIAGAVERALAKAEEAQRQ